MTAVVYELADADGDDYARLGAEEAELYANVTPDAERTEGKEAFVVKDVGRNALLAGRTALAGFAEDFHTDRIMPRRLGRPAVQWAFLGPENYLG